MRMRFIGLDLAWSPCNNSGGVAIEDSAGHAHWIASPERLGNDAEVFAFVRDTAGTGPALVAIDAPLIVPNAEGSRPVDRQITHLFGRFEAGCYPAYRNRPGGCTRGEKIVAALAEICFRQDPYIEARGTARSVFEVYPHPATLALFHLCKTIKYKARPNRDHAFRCQELERLRHGLIALQQAKPALHLPPEITEVHVPSLQGGAFKRYEDRLDGAICAYIAYYAWYWGPQGYEVYAGDPPDLSKGYILVPMTNWLRGLLAGCERLASEKSQDA